VDNSIILLLLSLACGFVWTAGAVLQWQNIRRQEKLLARMGRLYGRRPRAAARAAQPAALVPEPAALAAEPAAAEAASENLRSDERWSVTW
jgi:hypothetical protein